MTFSDLYRGHARRLARMAQRMLGSANDAEDIAHDAFLRAYVAELGDSTDLSAALLTVTTRRLALNEIRNRTRRATHTVGDVGSLGVLSTDDPAADLETVELRRSIVAAMAEMPPQCCNVFRMRKIEDLSHAEISARLGISPKMVERHLTRALKLCRSRLISDGHVSASIHADREETR